MSATQITPEKLYTIGSREWEIANLSRSLRRHADQVDVMADQINEWGWNPTARGALGFIERGVQMARDAQRFYDTMKSLGVGDNTRASYRNEACRIGAGGGLNDRGTVGYGLMYALGEVEKVEDGTYNRVELRQSRTAVQASGMRCHASNCRVIAQLLDRLAAGEIWGIR